SSCLCNVTVTPGRACPPLSRMVPSIAVCEKAALVNSNNEKSPPATSRSRFLALTRALLKMALSVRQAISTMVSSNCEKSERDCSANLLLFGQKKYSHPERVGTQPKESRRTGPATFPAL